MLPVDPVWIKPQAEILDGIPRCPQITHSAKSLAELPADVEHLIDRYEVELKCTHCQATSRQSIASLRGHTQMTCPSCKDLILVGTAALNEEIRRVSKQMRLLQRQLDEALQRAIDLLGK